GKKSKLKTSLFFPLSVLDLEVEPLPLRELHRLKEAERQFPLYDLCTNMTKISVAFFLSEFLSRV
ncbi:MAG TPA: DNA repair protein RecO, partial [Porphyromonadaceae bacterium]|nr:DNA repair protein RecO [Porphyromonadaceae bacterium]